MRRIVQKKVYEDRRERVRELDGKIESLKAEKLLDEFQVGHEESDDLVEQTQNEGQESLLEDESKFDERNGETEDSGEPDVHRMDGEDFNECPF